jgi:hypothetical protein
MTKGTFNRYRRDRKRPPILVPSLDIYPRTDGMFQIGLDDKTACGPFESLSFAAAVVAQVQRRSKAARR